MKKQEREELRTELVKVWGNSKNMVEHCLKNVAYVKVGGKFVDIGRKKPTITKEFWFDDEKPIPEVSKELFIKGNKRKNLPNDYDMYSSHGDKAVLVHQYNEKGENVNIYALTYLSDEQKENYDYHELTEDELDTMNEARKELREKYIKRLESYWKRYSKHVRCRGYWVNR